MTFEAHYQKLSLAKKGNRMLNSVWYAGFWISKEFSVICYYLGQCPKRGHRGLPISRSAYQLKCWLVCLHQKTSDELDWICINLVLLSLLFSDLLIGFRIFRNFYYSLIQAKK